MFSDSMGSENAQMVRKSGIKDATQQVPPISFTFFRPQNAAGLGRRMAADFP
jgi:hypothetical protein